MNFSKDVLERKSDLFELLYLNLWYKNKIQKLLSNRSKVSYHNKIVCVLKIE